MKQRILVAIIGVPALIGVLCFAPDWATAVLVAALCVIGCHEFMAAAAPEKAAHWWGLAATLAADVQAAAPAEEKPEGQHRYVCKVCGYVYEGDSLPEDYKCPLCGAGAEYFKQES